MMCNILQRFRKASRIGLICFFGFLLAATNGNLYAQQQTDSAHHMPHYKNIIRYNLSGAMLFGMSNYIVFGYERVISPHQSFSINVGRIALPKLISINTDSFSLQKDLTNSGYNISVDYRFYLEKENKYEAPHGLYIGPYFSYNHFTRDNRWDYKNSGAASYVDTHSTFNITTVGAEMGYQFILWKRLALDFVMVGPGIGFYKYHADFETNVDAATQEQLYEALKQLLNQKFPGMGYVFADKQFDANGVLRANTLGYRYLIHIGFAF